MKHPIKTLVLYVGLALGWSYPAFPGERVILAEANRPTDKTIQSILKFVIEKRIGADVATVRTTPSVAFQSMSKGDGSIDVYGSLWMPYQTHVWKNYVAEGSSETIDVNDNPYISHEGLFIPGYIQDKYGIFDVYDLVNPEHAALFDIDGDGKGEYWPGDTGWYSTGVEQVKAKSYGYDKYFKPYIVSDVVMKAKLEAAYEQKRGILIHSWTSDWIHSRYDLRPLYEPRFTGFAMEERRNDPLYNPEGCWAMFDPEKYSDWLVKSHVSCAWPKARTYIAFSESLYERARNSAKLLKQVHFEPEWVSSWSYEITVNKREPHEVATQWIEDNPGIIDNWLWRSLAYEPGSEGLFRPLPEPAKADIRIETDPAIIRSRLVEVDLSYFRKKVQVSAVGLDAQWTAPFAQFDVAPSAHPPILLDLFDDVSVVAKIDQVQPGGLYADAVLVGRDIEDPFSEVILTITKRSITGNIRTGGRLYRIRPVTDTIHAVAEVNPSGLPDEAPPELYEALEEEQGSVLPDLQNSAEPVLADGPIDVMVLFTAESSKRLNIGQEATLMIAQANAAHRFSRTVEEDIFNLVYVDIMDYTSAGYILEDLRRLQNPSDRYMDEAHRMRDAHHADLVSLIVKNSDYCGMAYLNPPEPGELPQVNRAFSVTRVDCARTNLSLAHELGHNLGANHDRYVVENPPPDTYNYGFVKVEEGWRTVMSYNRACSDQGIYCQRRPRFSNPDLGTGVPVGDPEAAYNVKMFQETRRRIAAFR